MVRIGGGAGRLSDRACARSRQAPVPVSRASGSYANPLCYQNLTAYPSEHCASRHSYAALHKQLIRSGEPSMPEPLADDGLIRKLWIGEAARYRDHLLRLDDASRHSRFGGGVSDE